MKLAKCQLSIWKLKCYRHILRMVSNLIMRFLTRNKDYVLRLDRFGVKKSFQCFQGQVF